MSERWWTPADRLRRIARIIERAHKGSIPSTGAGVMMLCDDDVDAIYRLAAPAPQPAAPRCSICDVGPGYQHHSDCPNAFSNNPNRYERTPHLEGPGAAESQRMNPKDDGETVAPLGGNPAPSSTRPCTCGGRGVLPYGEPCPDCTEGELVAEVKALAAKWDADALPLVNGLFEGGKATGLRTAAGELLALLDGAK